LQKVADQGRRVVNEVVEMFPENVVDGGGGLTEAKLQIFFDQNKQGLQLFQRKHDNV
jgi:hypothetical protein